LSLISTDQIEDTIKNHAKSTDDGFQWRPEILPQTPAGRIGQYVGRRVCFCIVTVWARQVMRVREWGHVFGTFPELLTPEEKLQ
jgi:hypothetical protein